MLLPNQRRYMPSLKVRTRSRFTKRLKSPKANSEVANRSRWFLVAAISSQLTGMSV